MDPEKISRQFTIENQYLNFPVKQGTKTSLIHFIIDDKIEREFEVPLAIGEPDFWIFLDVSEFKGKKVTLSLMKSLSNEKQGKEVASV